MTAAARLRLGGLLWVAAAQFFVAEAVSAMFVPGGYSYRSGYISDLGATACAAVCSPLHDLMNASFVLQGALIAGGLALNRHALGQGATALAGKLCLAICAAGVAIVGVAPENVAPGWHYAGAAANLAGCNMGALLVGIAPGGVAAPVRRLGIVAGAIGLAGLSALVFGGAGALGVGILERLAADPFLVWLIAVGVSLAAPFARAAPAC